ncbi:MAG: hypothetical protein IKZ02_07230 [Alphaproteobacteria bacterium]|nr:hypothetical protein [Alphaproteobacteria bacterium]
MKEYTYDILIENNFSMFPELCSHPMVVDSVYNRHNDYYIDKKEKKKHLFNMCIVLNDCDFSNQPILKNNLTSPAIVFGTYIIEGTNISDLKDAPRFAFKGANIKGTPLAQQLGTDFLTPQEYNKLWQQHNGSIEELSDLVTLPEKMPFTDKSNRYDAKTVYIFNNVTLPESTNNLLPNCQNIVALGNCDYSNCPKLSSLHNGVAYIGGDLNISNTRIFSLYEAIPPRCLKGNLICTGTKLAQKLGKDVLTPDEYKKAWEEMNQPIKHRCLNTLSPIYNKQRNGRSG